MRPTPRRAALPALCLAVCAAPLAGCHARWSPLGMPSAYRLTALDEKDPFPRDGNAAIGEPALQALLDAPVELDPSRRLGLLPVGGDWRPLDGLVGRAVPQEITRSLHAAGFFPVSTELAPDWPAGSGLGALRELGARYRASYLLLYRQRFAAQEYTNAWIWLWPTLVGPLIAPSKTLETAGVVEATLFDVRTGAILFTVFEQVHAEGDERPAGTERKLRAMQEKLVGGAAARIAGQVVEQVRALAGAAASRRPPAVPLG